VNFRQRATFFPALLLVAASTLHAQPVTLRYAFVQGKTYVYRAVWDQTQVNAKGESTDSFIHSSDLEVFVEHVDSLGEMILTCTVLDQGYIRKKPGKMKIQAQLTDSLRYNGRITRAPFEEAPSYKSVKLTAVRPDMVPKYRIRLSPQGKYLSGKVLQKSQMMKDHEKALKDPHVRTKPIDEDILLNLEAHQFFKPLPAQPGLFMEKDWIDTTVRDHSWDRGGPSTEHRTFRIVNRPGTFGLPFRILTEKLKKIVQTPGNDVGSYTERASDAFARTSFRKSDGVYFGYENVYTHRLISVDDEDRDSESFVESQVIESIRLILEK
jgi:hypothetical protein